MCQTTFSEDPDPKGVTCEVRGLYTGELKNVAFHRGSTIKVPALHEKPDCFEFEIQQNSMGSARLVQCVVHSANRPNKAAGSAASAAVAARSDQSKVRLDIS
jgi:hypothetical protein